MNAQVKPSVVQRSIAAEHIRQCRAVLADDGKTPEQTALSFWWGSLRRTERRALIDLAGIHHGNTGNDWMQLPAKQRAAIAVTASLWAEKLASLASTLSEIRTEAVMVLKHERNKQRSKIAA
jgi:hypothetical protein